jgi:hypothetical protein
MLPSRADGLMQAGHLADLVVVSANPGGPPFGELTWPEPGL